MAATLQNIPIFVLEHKWSSDIESNVCSDIEETLERFDHSKENAGHSRKLSHFRVYTLCHAALHCFPHNFLLRIAFLPLTTPSFSTSMHEWEHKLLLFYQVARQRRMKIRNSAD